MNPSYTTGVSGSDVVAFASQYVGYPYKYGGNSLTMVQTAPILSRHALDSTASTSREIPTHYRAVDRQSAMRMHRRVILSATRDMWQFTWGTDVSCMRRAREAVSVTEMQPTVPFLQCAGYYSERVCQLHSLSFNIGSVILKHRKRGTDYAV